jgi:hypothetical protein
MTDRRVLVSCAAALAALLAAAAPAMVLAQQAPRSQFPDPRIYDPRTYNNEELTPGQIQRAQEPEPPAGRDAAPKAAPKAAPQAAPKQPAQPAHTIACSGVFAKESSHLKLATLYKPDNVTFMEIDASDGKKLMASVLFAKDPKRRLEVWWENEASRTGTHLIVIGGQSTWTAPKGMRLGLQLAAIERLNGKPFKLKGFDKDNLAAVSDWQGGALAALPGGCKVGFVLRADPKVPPEARNAVPATAEFTSSDAAVKTVKPAVAEILLGY